MKKFISIILVALFALTAISFTACSINETEVSILWSESGEVKVPDSLINCIDRAMYIENISYKHYGADGDAERQLDQAKAAVDQGCAALVVEPVSAAAVGEFIKVAKGKDIPVIFIGDDAVDAAVKAYEFLAGEYDKCVVIKSNTQNIADVQGKLIADYVKANFASLDRNGDGKISYVSYTSIFSADSAKVANALLKEDEEYKISVGSGCNKDTTTTELVFYDADNKTGYLPSIGAAVSQTAIMEKYNDEKKNTVELIITDNDATAREVLVALQAKDFNTNKLTTHFIPVFTVGFDEDYKALVLAGAPEDEDKRAEYFESCKYLCDLTVVEEADLEVMIWNTKNVIASGRLAGTVIEDQDALAGAIAAVIRNLIKGNKTFDGLNADNVDGKTYLVDYIPN